MVNNKWNEGEGDSNGNPVNWTEEGKRWWLEMGLVMVVRKETAASASLSSCHFSSEFSSERKLNDYNDNKLEVYAFADPNCNRATDVPKKLEIAKTGQI